MRGGTAGLTFPAGLLAVMKRGLASILVVIGSIGLSLMEGHLLWTSVGNIPQVANRLPELFPGTVTQGLALLAALRTAWQTRK